ncbi:DNA-binding transcriptional regulator, MerR family [Enhydrobacter aerosaccus]|uniref:DNA-binding transcriptional regulator, MerR family n=1 Tax=Enhydrobacter aerosaccus TaxID=225324 RepID=A0A1T4SKL6_9HYPH|nr:helix-turn-helix domain-containing protein [Enhydrobacter aerosaccus]SKA28742.1 DNA-binding transcriptional regulator, MerR family [Enhydrobacter aerosaccus]
MMSIGTLSKKSGVHIETIRYYERAGVLPKARRAPNGRRVYGHEDTGRLAFIRQARELGFELISVRALLALQERPELSCKAASQLASAQLAAVESRLNRLIVLRDELRRMVRACKNGRVGDCRVIEALTNMH